MIYLIILPSDKCKIENLGKLRIRTKNRRLHKFQDNTGEVLYHMKKSI